MLIEIGFDPVLAQIGPFQLAWHGLFTALAVLVAVAVGIRRGERRGAPADDMSTLALWAILGGLVGARLFHVLDHLPYFVEHPLEAFAIWQGGIAVYGAFIGGVVAGLIVARRLSLPTWRLLDAAAPAMLIGQAIGRLGCLSNGDAWGAPTGANWGVVYTNPGALLPPSLLGVPTHPYPLYEIVLEVLLLGVLWLLERRGHLRSGVLFFIAVLGYAAIRFSLSYFRQETVVALGLQEAQVIAVLTALIAVFFLFARLASRPVASPALPD